jgi:photosystem II stability/assembly factor-like uncharacterized protein
MAAQRAYPDNNVKDSKYFEAFQKLNHNPNVSLREDTDPWESLGPHNTAGRTLALAFNPENPNTVYAGSASGGLWRSYTMGEGVSWEYVSTGFPVLGISSIAFSPQDSNQIYLGTGEVYNYRDAGTGAAFRSTRGTYGIGIIKSEDGGETWASSLDWTTRDETGVNEIKVAPSDDQIVYAATTEGTYKSIDAGASWKKMHDAVMTTDLVIHPEDPNIIIIACGNFGSANRGIYRSINGGKTWVKAGSPIPANFQGKILLDISFSNPNYVYASVGNGFGFQDGATWLCRSTDMGVSWEVVNETDYSLWQGWFSHDIAVNPQNELDLVLVGIDLWKSSNGGEDITQVSAGGLIFGTPEIGVTEGPPNYSHSDHHVVIYHPSDTSIVFYGNDGGVNVSLDNGYSFETRNGGYQSVQFYNGFSVSQNNNDFALGGLQDNSTVIYRGSKAWTKDIGGDGGWTATNPLNDDIVFASSQFLTVVRSINQGFNFTLGLNIPSQNERTSFIAPYVLAPSNPTTMYAARSRVYKSDNNGNDFQATNNNQVLNGDPVFCLAVSPLNQDIVIAATAPLNQTRAVFITTNGGDTWDNINLGLPILFPTDVCFSPDKEGTAYITFGGFGEGHVYMTTDFGSKWSNITGNLPDVPTSAITVDPDAPHQLYVGNDLGVFVSTDFGESWDPYNDGFFGASLVMDLQIMKQDRKLYVATHGNGAFRRDLLEQTSPVEDVVSSIESLKLYPNPANHTITLELMSNDSKDIKFEIVSLDGKVILSEYETVKNGKNEKQIDLTQFIPGNYFFNISGNGENQSIQFTKI